MKPSRTAGRPAAALALSAAAVVVVAVLSSAAAGAPDALPAAFLGCFQFSGLSATMLVTTSSNSSPGSMLMSMGASLLPYTTASEQVQPCLQACKQRSFAFAAIGADASCRCTTLIPDVSAMLPDKACADDGVVLYYIYAGASSTVGCRLAEVPVSPASFSVAYNDEAVTFWTNDTVSLKIDSTKSGTRVTTTDGDHLYGVFQIAAQVSGAEGVVSAFYLRSSDVYPNELAGPFSEIDFEFCNAKPCLPNSIWLNSLTGGLGNGEKLVPPSMYETLIGKRVDEDYVIVTINWGPDELSWHADGRLLNLLRDGDSVKWWQGDTQMTTVFKSPDKASHVTLSMWTDLRPDPEVVFGGVMDLSKAPYHSYFTGLKRVLCDVTPAKATLLRGELTAAKAVGNFVVSTASTSAGGSATAAGIGSNGSISVATTSNIDSGGNDDGELENGAYAYTSAISGPDQSIFAMDSDAQIRALTQGVPVNQSANRAAGGGNGNGAAGLARCGWLSLLLAAGAAVVAAAAA